MPPNSTRLQAEEPGRPCQKRRIEEIEAASVHSATETPNVGTQACDILCSDLQSSTSHCTTARLSKLSVSALEYR